MLVSKSPWQVRETRRKLQVAFSLVGAVITGGTSAYLWKHGLPVLSDAAATIIGSALGAGLSVWGAYFASLISQRRRNVDFEEVAEEFVDNLAFEAQMMNAMCFDLTRYIDTTEDRIRACRSQGRMLREAIDFFESHIAAAAFGSFDVRLRIAKLSSIVRSERLGLSADIAPEYLINSYAISSKVIMRGCREFWVRDLDVVERMRDDAFEERARQLCGR